MDFRHDILPLKDKLYRLALRITLNHQEAEDIVQDTLIKVWNKRDSWAEIESIEAYAMTVCRNLSLDHLKLHDNQNTALEAITTERPDHTPDPLEQTARKDQLQQVRRIIDSLPEKQRSCMQLRDFEGMAYKEIARVMGISEEQVKISIFRARKTVKEAFERQNNFGI